MEVTEVRHRTGREASRSHRKLTVYCDTKTPGIVLIHPVDKPISKAYVDSEDIKVRPFAHHPPMYVVVFPALLPGLYRLVCLTDELSMKTVVIHAGPLIRAGQAS